MNDIRTLRTPSPSAKASAQVTVVMPAYRCEQFVGEAIASVLSQTFENFILHVHDDGSDDDTLQSILKSCDDRCLVTSGANRGVAASRNFITSQVATPWLCFHDADDLSLPHRIQTELDYAISHNLDVVSAEMEMFGPSSWEMYSRPELTHDRIVAMLLLGATVPNAPALVRTELAQRHPQQESFHVSEDYDMWCRFVVDGARFYVLPEVLYRYRIHGANTTLQHEQSAPAVPAGSASPTMQVMHWYHSQVLQGPGAKQLSDWLTWTAYEPLEPLTDVQLMDSSLWMAFGGLLDSVTSDVIKPQMLREIALSVADRQFIRRASIASAAMLLPVARHLGLKPALVGVKRGLKTKHWPLRSQANQNYPWAQILQQ